MWWPRSATRSAGASARAVVRGVDQPDADAAHGVQVARLGGALAELSPQPRQVHVDGAVAAAVRLLPHLREQLALGEHLTGPRRQRHQEVELLAGQLQRTSGQGGRTGANVDLEL